MQKILLKKDLKFFMEILLILKFAIETKKKSKVDLFAELLKRRGAGFKM